MAAEGWYSTWFANGWFPSVWFAPGDESGIPEDELRQEYRGNGSGRHGPWGDPFADLDRIVREKWEAIEQADARDLAQSADVPAQVEAAPPSTAEITHPSPEQNGRGHGVAIEYPGLVRKGQNIALPALPSIGSAAAVERQKADVARAMRAEEEEFLLMLADE